MARVDELFNYLQTPGLTDQQIAAEINRLGVTAQEVSQLTGVPVADVQSRLTAVAPAPTPAAELLNYLQTPGLTDQQIAAEVGRLGVTAQEVSQLTGVPVADVQARLAAPAGQVVTPPVVQPPVVQPPVVQPPVVQPPVVQPPVVQPPVTRTNQDIFRDFLMTPNLTDAQIAIEMRRLGISNQQLADISGYTLADVNRRYSALTPIDQFRAYLMTPGLTDAQITAEMGRLGITNKQGSDITGVPVREIEDRINATSGTMPFANAMQGVTQNFQNYTSIPIGAQYNPAAVGGTGSPYSQIMAQMRPVGNPYAAARQGLPMGGYDPGIYDAGLLDRVVRERAAKAGTGTDTSGSGGYEGVGNQGGIDDSFYSGMGLGSNNAPVESMGTDSGGYGTNVDGGYGAGGYGANDNFGGFFKGGLINQVAGADPAGPDEGQINAQKGEYVVKKSSVKKYGKGLLDMINDGKIPAKKIKSLLD